MGIAKDQQPRLRVGRRRLQSVEINRVVAAAAHQRTGPHHAAVVEDAVVKNIVTTLGWTITVDSEKNVGTTFTITMPL